ncbi:MAG: prolyl oligopeptidase family serine peptidase [Planctomycetaceae bacterium]|nr:prolyl oligopeptidase family serine peptidase [Planctomycetaceae bacterium]
MQSVQQEKEFKDKASLKYLLYVPKTYDANSEKMPLIIFLHGAGERGDDLNRVKVHGIPKMIENGEDFPFIVVSPQCPEKGWWTDYTQTLKSLIDSIVKEYNVDESRIYMTGLSMGGFGTWNMIARYPDFFAAAAPVCGGGDAFFAKYIKTPVWAFHGAKDDTVPMVRSQEMVDVMKTNGVEVEFTIYPELGHNCWDAAYANEQLYKWFLKHKRDNSKK